MRHPRPPLIAIRIRPLAVWLLAVLVLAQAVAASVVVTLGPAHVHEAAAAVEGLEYFDLRRASAPTSRPRHVLSMLGHFHADGAPQRHHHRRDDSSVAGLDGPAALQPDEASDATFAAAIAAIALPTSAAAWLSLADRGAPVAAAPWAWLTDDPEPLDKPPRLA